MKIKVNILVITLFWSILSSSCSFQKNDKKEMPLTVDSLMHIANESFEVIEIELLQDTIVIVSTNDMLFYPFGKYVNFNEFQKYYLETHIKGLKIECLKSKNGLNIVNIQNKNSFLKLIEAETFRNDGRRLELVSANIHEADFTFVNGIKIGMNKRDFLFKIFSIVPNRLEKVSVVKIESAVDIVWHYYTFSEDNTIKNIIIKTDYIL